MRPIIVFLLSQSILLPLIAGLIRFRRLGRRYQPFFGLILIGVIAEISSYLMIQGHNGSNAIPDNIFVLFEWTLIALQFHVWGFLKQKKRLFYAFLMATSLFWVIENLVFKNIITFSPYFRFFFSFLIVLLSVNEINFMITHDNRNLFRNPTFVICIGFIIYFIYNILYEWAYQVSSFGASEITSTIIYLMAYVNILINIIYAIAFLLVPAKVKFTLK